MTKAILFAAFLSLYSTAALAGRGGEGDPGGGLDGGAVRERHAAGAKVGLCGGDFDAIRDRHAAGARNDFAVRDRHAAGNILWGTAVRDRHAVGSKHQGKRTSPVIDLNRK